MSDSAQAYVAVTVSPDPGFTLDFTNMRGTEELGRPFLFTLEVSSDQSNSNLTAMLGSSMTVSITLPDKSNRYFNGIITRAVFTGLSGAVYNYTFELRPWIWLLSQEQDSRIYQNMAVWDIILASFRKAGFSDFADQRQNSTGSTVLDYCVQFNETTLAFVTRLMEVYGLYYFFTHADGVHTLNMADDPGSHQALANALPYEFDETDYRSVTDHVWGLSSSLSLQPGRATVNDYNFTTPDADLTGTTSGAAAYPYGSFEVYEYPGWHTTQDEGSSLVAVLQERLSLQGASYTCSSNARGLYAGCKFTLSGYVDTTRNTEYLVVAANYAVDMAEAAARTTGDLPGTFRCGVTLIGGTNTYRLARSTPWPVMRGPQTARVVGESGQEITTDQYGRIKVKFFWDRSAAEDQTASCWIRVAQVWAGTGWGGIVIPRIGQEVVVDFLDGNPDRPLVTGCVYNANTTVPYTLPDNMTRSTFRTNSSTGGGGNNELRFEDKAGSEEVFLQAQKDYNIVVLNNETQQITQSSTKTVKQGDNALTVSQGNNTITVSAKDNSLTVSQGNNSVTVSQGNNSLTVSQGNNSTTVSTGNDSLTVSTGNHSITVSAGSSTINAGNYILLQVGGNSVRVDTDGVTVVGSAISLQAEESLTADGGGSMTLQAGSISIN